MSAAVAFLQNPKVSLTPTSRKVAFLESKVSPAQLSSAHCTAAPPLQLQLLVPSPVCVSEWCCVSGSECG